MLGGLVNMEGDTGNDGDVRTGDGRSRTRMRRKDGPDRGGGEAHVAEWPRVGAKRVLGDVGRGEGPCEGSVLMVGVVVDSKGVGNDGDVKNPVWERRRGR